MHSNPPVRSTSQQLTFRNLLKPFRLRIFISLCFQIVKDSPLWIIPVITAAVIDTVVAGQDTQKLGILIAAAVLVLAQNYPCHLAYVHIYSRVYRGVASNLRNQITEHLQQLSIGSHSRLGAAVLQTKLIRDVENIEVLLQTLSPVIAVSASILVGSIVITAIQVPAFLIVYLLTVPLGVVLVVRMRKRAGSTNEEFRRKVEDLAFNLNEINNHNDLIRAHSLENIASLQLASSTESVKQAGLALDRVNSRFESASWVSFNILSISCLGLAAWASITGFVPITTGQVVLLGTYFAMLTTGVSGLVGLTPVISKGIESMKSIDELLKDPDVEDNQGKPELDNFEGKLRFSRVSYSYPQSNSPAIDNLDLEIKTGETIALVGASGSGKSTVTSLILGFVRPSEGHIYIDGNDVNQIDMRSFRKFVSVVLQEPKIMSASVRENITFGMNDVSESRIHESLHLSNSLEFVEQLPQGLDTLLGGQGIQLSGGQRQRLAIARAIIRDPKLLILDEATSALDGTSEAAVREALEKLMQSRTCIVIAHRLSTIQQADRILVLEKGKILEIGTHDELLKNHGKYEEFYRISSK